MTRTDERRQGFFAVVRWTVFDIHSHRQGAGLEAWTDAKASEWLGNNETRIQDAIIPAGWDAIEALMDGEVGA
jgi:hypothetical protein